MAPALLAPGADTLAFAHCDWTLRTDRWSVGETGWRDAPGPGQYSSPQSQRTRARLHAFRGGSRAILLLAILAAGRSSPLLPPIPQPSLDGFAAAVQHQLRSSRAEADASPVDAAPVARLGRMI